MISTRGRYALRVMLDLAEQKRQTYIPMKEVAARQNISLKYIERIMPLLTKGKLVEGMHGKGGGYRLCRAPEDCSVWEILSLVEGDMAPVACLSAGSPSCERAAGCRTLPMWKKYYELTRDYFSGITLGDLIEKSTDYHYII